MSKNKHNRNNPYNSNMPRNNNEVVEDIVEENETVTDNIEDGLETDIVDNEIVDTPDMEIVLPEVIDTPEIKTTENIASIIPEIIDIPTSVVVEANGYHVGTDCIVNDSVFTDWERARNFANKQTIATGVIHHVYDLNNKVVFSAKKKLTLLSHKKRGNRNVNWYS